MRYLGLAAPNSFLPDTTRAVSASSSPKGTGLFLAAEVDVLAVPPHLVRAILDLFAILDELPLVADHHVGVFLKHLGGTLVLQPHPPGNPLEDLALELVANGGPFVPGRLGHGGVGGGAF